MQWWAWVAGGGILLGAELAFVDAQFYLVLLGASAMVVGLASLVDAAFRACSMKPGWIGFASTLDSSAWWCLIVSPTKVRAEPSSATVSG